MKDLAQNLDTSKKAKSMLDKFLDVLEDIQSEITDLDGASFGCFPFEYSRGNKTCRESSSPVCTICRELRSESKGD